jgi:hypothetical protein
VSPLDVLGVAAGLATTMGIIVAIYQLCEVRHQTTRQIEDSYVHRYWELMDRLPVTIVAGRDHDFEDLDAAQVHAAIAYLRLCDDEVALRQGGWISEKTWQMWSEAMVTSCQRKPFSQILSTTEVALFNPQDFASLAELTGGGVVGGRNRRWWSGGRRG